MPPSLRNICDENSLQTKYGNLKFNLKFKRKGCTCNSRSLCLKKTSVNRLIVKEKSKSTIYSHSYTMKFIIIMVNYAKRNQTKQK